MSTVVWVVLLALSSIRANEIGQNDLQAKETCSIGDLGVHKGRIICRNDIKKDILLDVSLSNDIGNKKLTVGVGAECVHQCPLTNTSSLVWCAGQDLWEGDSLKCVSVTGTDLVIGRQKRIAAETVIGIIGIGISLVEFFCNLFCPQKEDRDSSPPTINCPVVPTTFYTPENSRSVKVSWGLPSASDNSGQPGVRLASGRKPGSEFEGSGRGNTYTVLYEARDSSGLTATCHFSFTVYVRECPIKSPPQNGFKQCSHAASQIPIFGDTCTFSCNAGFTLVDSARQKCGQDRKWNGGDVQCQRISCGQPPTPKNGALMSCTNDVLFESICTFSCDKGFAFPVDHNVVRYVQCQSDSSWSSTPSDCKDITPPVISNCPDNLLLFAERGLNSTVATWTSPTAEDNIDGTIATVQTSGKSSGSVFESGTIHVVQYEATDSAGNKADICSFTITVQETVCPSPFPSTHLQFICEPDRLTYGAYCNFTCYRNLPLIGLSQVFCERSPDNPAIGVWDWGTNSTPPYCEYLNCPLLNDPLNGALACDAWSNGERCQMFCNDNWDIPRTAPADGSWVCSMTDGKWKPETEVPDCSEIYRPDQIRLPNELFYYSGDCTNTSVQDEIKQMFIDVLNQSNYRDICILQHEKCYAENVIVSCGPVVSKRSVDFLLYRIKRQAENSHRIVIKWDLILDINYDLLVGLTPTQLWDTLDGKLSGISDSIRESIDAGQFDLLNTSLEIDIDRSSYQTGWSDMSCPLGWLPRDVSFTCAPCSTGTFYNQETQECTSCPVGMYQNESGQLECEKCPEATSTLTTGSRNISSCISTCQPGKVSNTGLAPCAQCPAGTYQPAAGQTSCISCPAATTNIPGSTNVESCSGFELLLRGPVTANVSTTFSPSVSAITLTAWLRIRQTDLLDENWTILTLQSADVTMSLLNPTHPTLTIQSTSDAGSGSVASVTDIKDDNWHHLALTWDSSTCTINIYINGLPQNSVPVNDLCGLQISPGASIILGSSLNTAHSKVAVSMLSIWPEIKDPSELQEMLSTCLYDDTTALVSWGSFLSSGAALMSVPSTCGDGNNCIPNPCNGHPCIDKVQDFVCKCEWNYTGRNCEMKPDFCAVSLCQNGATCNETDTDYSCVCPDGFKGRLCEQQIVNGGWSSWTGWSECSQSCGESAGQQSRTRSCTEPTPDPDGLACIGPSTEEKMCNQIKCPECMPLRRQFGHQIQCNNTEDGGHECSIRCIAGYASAKTFQDKYICGPITNYTWIHDDSQLPKCTEFHPPKYLVLNNVFEIDGPSDIPEVVTNEAHNAVESKLNEVTKVQCLTDGKCESEVQLSGYGNNDSRKKRSYSVMVVHTMTVNLSDADFFVDGVFDEAKAYSVIEDWADSISDLETAATLLKEAIEQGILTFTIDGQEYTANTNSLLQTGEADCIDGTQNFYGLCLDCEPGYYGQGGQCLPCQVGYYQDLEGQVDCLPCPANTSTFTVGADNITLCSAVAFTVPTPTKQDPEADNAQPEDIDDLGLPIGVSIGVSVLVLTAVTIAFISYKKHALKKTGYRVRKTSTQGAEQNLRPTSPNKIVPIFEDRNMQEHNYWGMK